jgi:hypothetical protein
MADYLYCFPLFRGRLRTDAGARMRGHLAPTRSRPETKKGDAGPPFWFSLRRLAARGSRLAGPARQAAFAASSWRVWSADVAFAAAAMLASV